MPKIVKHIEVNCDMCGENLAELDNNLDVAIDSLRASRVIVMKWNGQEYDLFFCPGCSDFFEKKLKLAWKERSEDIIQFRQSVREKKEVSSEVDV